MTWIITNLKRNVNVKTSWSCYYIVSCPTRLSKIQRSEIYSKYSKFLNFSRHNFPSIYKLNFYCWTVVSLIRLSAPPLLLFQMRNVAANFKVLNIGSDNFDQVCVFYIVLTLYQNQPNIVALKVRYQNTQNTPKRPQITPKMSLNHHQNVPTPSKNVLKSPPDHPRTSPEHPSTSLNHLDCPKTSLNHPKTPQEENIKFTLHKNIAFYSKP